MSPDLRFPEFTDDVRLKRFGDVVKLRKKKFNPLKSSESRRDIELDNLATETGGVLGYVDSRTQMSIKNVFQKDDILFGKLRPYLKKFAKAPWDGVSSSEIWALYSDEINSDYLLQLVQTRTFNDSVNIQSGSKMPRADWGLVSDAEYNIPLRSEQEKIADFLAAVDERIDLGKKTIELLKQYKKGVMQKIFSQQIRFKDESGKSYPNWETKMIGDFMKERKEYAPKDGRYEHISLTTAGVVPKSERYERDFLVGSEDKKYRITRVDDICYNPANLKFGVIARNKYREGIFSPIYVTYEVKNADVGFVEYLVTRNDFIQYARKFEEGTVYERMAVSPKDLATLVIKMPTIEEQKKIAVFLTTLDEKIASEQVKLTSARQFKAALLQRLFV